MDWNFFNKKKSKSDQTDISDELKDETTQNKGITAKKGHPTPKRNQVQQSNLHPLVPKDRKASRKAAKERNRRRQDAEYEAMRTGDITHMPAAERLPLRIYIRDYVDSRWNIAEFFMPFILVMLVLSLLILNWMPVLSVWFMGIMYLYFIVAIVDLFVLWHGLKKQLIKRYGPSSVDKRMRSGMYATQRAMNIRRWRLPKPRYPKHSDYKQWREKNISKDL